MALRLKTWVGVVVVLAVLGACLGYYFWRIQPTPSSPKKLKVGYLPLAASLPLFVASDQHYFQEAGFEVELVQFKSGNEMAIAGSQGDLDVMVTLATNAALDAMDVSGKKFEAFLANGYVKRTGGAKSTDYLLALPGQTLASLKGQKVAFFPGSVSRVFATIVLPKHGITLNDIEYVEMDGDKWLAALKSGQVKAVVAVEPYATMILDAGVAVPLIDGYIAEVFDGVPLSAAWFAGTRLQQDDKNKIVGVFRRAVSLIESDRDRALKSFEHYTKLPPALYTKIALNRWRLSADKDVREAFLKFARILGEQGGVRRAPEGDDWVWKNPQ